MENSVNERIKMLRNKLNVSQQDFATAIKTTTTTMSRIEAGQTNPRKSTLEAIIKKYGVSSEWLIDGIGELTLNVREQETNDNPWKDALVSQLKDENSFLKDQLKMMREMIQIIKPQANFHNGNVYSGFLAVAETNISVRA